MTIKNKTRAEIAVLDGSYNIGFRIMDQRTYDAYWRIKDALEKELDISLSMAKMFTLLIRRYDDFLKNEHK